ncbi:MAG: hypothetical protein J0H17_10315 [Rhizobiales bacterium]|nr:hypothetical protein [Hyphomicrobiales bacterium]
MAQGKVLFAGAVFSASLVLLSATAFAASPASCKEPKAGTKETPIFSPPRAAVVVGAGRLQFYSAPRVRCPISGVFVVPKDHLVVYAQTDDGWSSVMYINPRTGDDVSGWVRSVRLKDAGTVGPEQ